jgi:8-oxo-dGTP pyrophosphatase MutT (NUDIX family)
MSQLASHQELLAAALQIYRGVDAREEQHRETILAQVEASSTWWHRENLPGHVTGSAFVVDPLIERVLLHHHLKLDRWLQFGGHDEGERSPIETAVRELAEESGLQSFEFFGEPTIFDLDVHEIPARGAMPAHDHLDVRFLFVADADQKLQPAEGESRQLDWVLLEEAAQRMNEEGADRVITKLLALRDFVREANRPEEG